MSKPKRRQGSAFYYAQRAVPKDLHSVFGKYPLWKSLGTKDLEEAKPLCRRQHDAWDDEFKRERDKLKAATTPPRAVLGGQSPFESYEHQQFMERVWAEETHREDEHLERLDSDPLYRAQYLLAEKLNEQRQAIEDREADAQILREERLAAGKKDRLAGTPLSTMVERWAKGKTPTQKTVDRMHAVVRWFEDTNGKLTVEEITTADVQRWVGKLLEVTSPNNARTKLRNLSALLNWAATRDALKPILANPAAGLSVDVKSDPEDDVRAFELSELEAIFNTPVYSQGARPDAGSGDAAYWLPLLGLFTGGRLNEIGQIRPKDVYELPYSDRDGQEQTAWVIHIRADKADGLKLKNKRSERRVPVHPELVRLGFLRRVEVSRKAGDARVFADLRPDKYGTVTANWSKWFGRYRKEVAKVTDDRVRFHSFRHTFKDYIREAEIGEDVNDALTGHQNGTVSRRYGTSLKYPLRPLVAAMAEYRVTGLTLPAPPPTHTSKMPSGSASSSSS